MSSDWKFLSITHPWADWHGEAPKSPALSIASPKGTVRFIPFSPEDLARLAEQASRELGLYLRRERS